MAQIANELRCFSWHLPSETMKPTEPFKRQQIAFDFVALMRIYADMLRNVGAAANTVLLAEC